jgi:HEAT repeat protein
VPKVLFSLPRTLLGLSLWLGAGGLRSGFHTGDPLEELRAQLQAPDKWARAEAVEGLARLGSEPAWRLVIEALADPKGEVADTAELALAGLQGEKALRALLEEGGLRAKEPLVRVRAAEALGRLTTVPEDKAFGRALERALADEDPEVRRMAAWSCERLARAGRLDERTRVSVAEGLARRVHLEKDELASVRALAALGVLDPEAARGPLAAARRQRSALLRGGAAVLAPRVLPAAEALATLASLAADDEPSVRRAAIEALAELGTREALARLVERLGTESEERAVLRLVEHLQRLSGLKHRRDPRPWNDWLRALPSDWKGVPSRAPEPLDPASQTRTQLAGLPIVSRRVTILIDLSGSIWNVRPDGRTRKEIVDEKLREALEALTPDTRFNLIPYTGTPIPWKPGLTSATPAKVREAAGWFEALRENGSGNFWDAAMLALADPEVDTLIVLFDGAPTGGTRHRLELIAPLFLERNLARRVALDLVLVDASKKLQRLWGELAQGTGGRMVAVSF